LCAGEYAGGNINIFLCIRFLCIIFLGKDSCYGDSGGGLYMYDSNIKKNILVGIISYSEGCGRISKPG